MPRGVQPMAVTQFWWLCPACSVPHHSIPPMPRVQRLFVTTPTHCRSDLTANNIFYSEVVAVNLTNFGLHLSEVVTASF